MIPLEQQLTSLELSKVLKKLGVKQESLFEHVQDPLTPESKILLVTPSGAAKSYTHMHKVYSAFTVTELGEMLPWRSKKMETVNDAWLAFGKVADDYTVWYCDEDTLETKTEIFRERNEADARAKMLIYLLENNLITI